MPRYSIRAERDLCVLGSTCSHKQIAKSRLSYEPKSEYMV